MGSPTRPNGVDAMLRVISTLKVLAKDHSVSDQILEELKTE